MITVYVLRSILNGRRYVGITADLEQRLGQHQKPGATVARQLGRFTVIHTETFPDYAEARAREVFLKSGKGREWLDLQFAGLSRFQPDRFPRNAS